MKMLLAMLTTAFAVMLTAGETPWENFTDSWRLGRTTLKKNAEGTLTFEGPGKIYNKTFRIFPAVGSDPDKKFTGIAFKVKGDGSNEWVSITINSDPRTCGTYYFQLKKGVHEHRVAFADMAPAKDMGLAVPAVLTAGQLTGITVGEYWKITHNNAPRPAFSFQLSDLRLLDEIKPRFTPGTFRPAKLDGVIQKMKSGKAVSILCFGDSITAGSGLRNRAKEQYAVVLQDMLRKHYKNDKITVRSVAVGGAHTFQSIAWLDRDLAAGGIPDAATMLIGYNNRSACQTREFYRLHLDMWIDRFAAMTGGKAAVVLIPSVPGVPRFTSQQDMAEATREAAAHYGLPVAPVDKAIEKLGPAKYRAEFLADSVHPNPAGHRMFAEILFKTFAK